MPKPIIERIRQTRLAALREIKLANGYSFDAEVYANNPTKPPVPLAGKIILYQGRRSPTGDYAGDGANFNVYIVPFAAEVFLPARAQDDTRDWDEFVNYVATDIERALLEDRQCADPDTGRLMADDTQYVDCFEWSGEDGRPPTIPGITVLFTVTFEAIETEPDSQDP